MSANRDRPHVIVLPEDRANRQIANGFQLYLSLSRQRQFQVLPEAGGWRRVLARFNADYASSMDSIPRRLMVLLIDFDNDVNRIETAKEQIPGPLNDRVFVLGVLTQPENLRRAGLGSFEAIGRAMARDCHEGTNAIWAHKLLQHNSDELARLSEHVRPFLFS